MFVTFAIKGFLDHLRTETLSYFPIEEKYVYDENLDFRGRASQYLSRTGAFQRAEGEPPKNWVFIIWSRGDLSSSQVNNRPMRTTTAWQGDYNRVGGETISRMVSVSLSCKIVTNNIDLAEYIEEFLHINTGEFFTFEADYGDLGKMKCSADASTTTSFQKEDLAELGPVIGIGLEATINFPIFLPINEGWIIEQINEKIWNITSEGERGALLAEETILPD